MNSSLIYNLDFFALLAKSLDVAIIILSILVFFDVLIKFRRPLNLKIIILLIVIFVCIMSIFKFYSNNEQEYFFIFAICKIGAILGLLNFFCLIYFLNFRKFVTYFTLVTFTFVFVSQFYINYNHIQNVSRNGSAYTVEIMPLYAGFHLPFIFQIGRLLIVLITFSLLSFFTYRIIFKMNFENIYFKKIKSFTISIQLFVLSMLCLFLVRNAFKVDSLILNISVLFYFRVYILLIFLYRPDFLNRASSRISFTNLFNNKLPSVSEVEFYNHFFNQCYFKNNEANIQDFSIIMNLKVDDISYFVSQKYGCTFDDLVHKNRIQYFVDIIKDPQYQNFTIEALSKEIGYTSRSSFYKPFKRFHGGNPSDLIDVHVD